MIAMGLQGEQIHHVHDAHAQIRRLAAKSQAAAIAS